MFGLVLDTDISCRISVLMVMVCVWKCLWHYLVWCDLVWVNVLRYYRGTAATVIRICEICWERERERVKSQYWKNNSLDWIKWMRARSVCLRVHEELCGAMWRVVWWYMKGNVVLCEGLSGGTWRVICWYTKGWVVVREGSHGAVWRVVWWYVKGHVVLCEGSSVGTRRVV
jgi:hypothetical protein